MGTPSALRFAAEMRAPFSDALSALLRSQTIRGFSDQLVGYCIMVAGFSCMILVRACP